MSNDKNNKQEVAKQQESVSKRFTELVIKEFTSSVGGAEVTDMQRSLIQGYFIGCDNALASAEADRIKAGNKDKLPLVWSNVSVDSTLAQNIITYAKLGLDMSVANHLFAIPRMNNKTGKYQLSFQPGYKGREIVSRRYSYDPIVDITYGLIYSTDKFVARKRDAKNEFDNYELEITNPFNRGDVVGGFGYVTYENKSQNTLVLMSKAQIDKRRDKAMSKTFWSSWYEEMALKTVAIATCKTVTIDPKKVDDNYRALLKADDTEMQLADEVITNANGEIIDIESVTESTAQAIEQKAVYEDKVDDSVGVPLEEPSLNF